MPERKRSREVRQTKSEKGNETEGYVERDTHRETEREISVRKHREKSSRKIFYFILITTGIYRAEGRAIRTHENKIKIKTLEM